MSRTITKTPSGEKLDAPVAHRRHPWDEWCDGELHELERGLDFDQPVAGFRNRFYVQAAKRGLKVVSRTWVEADGPEAVAALSDGRRTVHDITEMIAKAGKRERLVLEDRLARMRAANEECVQILSVRMVPR